MKRILLISLFALIFCACGKEEQNPFFGHYFRIVGQYAQDGSYIVRQPEDLPFYLFRFPHNDLVVIRNSTSDVATGEYQYENGVLYIYALGNQQLDLEIHIQGDIWRFGRFGEKYKVERFL